MKNVSRVWSRSRLVLPVAGANLIWSEPPGPRDFRSRSRQKSGGSATLVVTLFKFFYITKALF